MKTCETCQWFDRRKDSYMGQCVRFPPTVLWVTFEYGEGRRGMRPDMPSDGRCGEWTAKETA